MYKEKPPEISIYAQVLPDKMLKDIRPATKFFKFGKVKDVARQHGITMEELPRCLKFTGPKSRLQLFAEKFHFSRVLYSNKPF